MVLRKTIFICIILLVTGNICAQTPLGIGIVSIKFGDKTTLNLYSSPNDKEPKRVIQFFYDSLINSYNIRNIESHNEWLKPEVMWFDYSQFVFRCQEIRENWLQLIVNNETGETLWVEKCDLTDFLNWEDYLKGIYGVARLSTQMQNIKSMPDVNSNDIIYNGKDCFKVKSMKGEWIEICNATYCDEYNTEKTTKINSGWIRWREGNRLLIEYFTVR